MPSKNSPKFYQLILKTHKLTIFLTVAPSATVAFIKQEALSALTSDVNSEDDVPKVTTESDFEICKLVRRRKDKYEYVQLDDTLQVNAQLSNWEALFFKFRDESGDLMPVEVTESSLTYNEEESWRVSQVASHDDASSSGKGKRKASDDD